MVRQHRQVRRARASTSRRQHCVDLPTVVGRVVEHMHDEEAELGVHRRVAPHPPHGAIDVSFGEAVRPRVDLAVQRGPLALVVRPASRCVRVGVADTDLAGDRLVATQPGEPDAMVP